MKVGYSATIWDGGRSGIGTYIAEQTAILSRRTDPETRLLEYGGAVLRSGETPRSGGTSQGIRRRLAPLSDILWHRRGLRAVATREKFDLIHVPTIRRLPGRPPCPSVVTVHDLGPLRLTGKYGPLRGFYHRIVVPRWLKSVNAIVTPSQFTKNDLSEFYSVDPSRITVVPNGVNHSVYKEGDVGESSALIQKKYGITSPFFVYISRLEHPAKNHVRLLAAFELFKKAHRLPHRLILVGSPWNGHEVIERAASELVKKKDVMLTGYVPMEDLPHFLRASVAQIYPSLFEGFGMPVTEAMACGTPVACSRSSSLTEIAEGHGILFDPENIEEMASALTRLATEESLRADLSKRGLAHAKSFTWDRSVNETVAVWRSTLGLHS